MSADEPALVRRRPAGPDAVQRLGGALLASIFLHALALAWPGNHRPAGRLPVQARPAPLLASLARPQAPPERPLPPPPAADYPFSVGQKVGADATPLSAKARFASPPDLSALEAVALAAPLRLHLRVQVTPQGRTGRVDIVDSLRVPVEFLAAVTEALAGARFIPGESGGTSVSSSLELVIEASPTEAAGIPGLLVGPPR